MDKLTAKSTIEKTFKAKFDKAEYRNFIINLLDGINEEKAFPCGNAQVKELYRDYVNSYARVGQYTDPNGKVIDVLCVNLKNKTTLDRARTTQRNFIADYMKQRQKENILVAFYNEDSTDWRFSFVKLDIDLKETAKGGLKIENTFTSAKRYSFLVGEQEPNHTAQKRLLPLLEKERPTLEELEDAFNIEKVSREFFANYKELFLQLVDNLKEIRKEDSRINFEFETRGILEADFCKKLLGQLVFLYFIQKKGWLGVENGKPYGTGQKDFLKQLFNRAVSEGKNFFNDYLEPLFYEALASGKVEDENLLRLNYKFPFLNGGLFETINDYDYINTDIILENEIFSNTKKTNDDVGTGILDVFDRYNFTVKEDEPLEKEVAVDPEMLGKVFEELLEVQDRKSKGAFYTPREIVHYMCQESLINYLCTELNSVDEDNSDNIIEENTLTKKALSDFIHYGDRLQQNEALSSEKAKSGDLGKTYDFMIHPAVRANAKEIDKSLQNIKICDPAIGSGAFPVGMMSEIVRARLTLLEAGFIKDFTSAEEKENYLAQQKYLYKRTAIQNSIYGVDIDCGAIDIAKLRLWLSLIVDEEDIENIKPLPNLDYKIVCGNSLLGVERNLLNDFYFQKLEELKPKYFNTTHKTEKRKLKKEIDEIIAELTKDGTFDFEIYFSEVFHENGGFDVVIANPPYVGQKGNKDIFEIIKKSSLSQFYQSKMDLFYFFFHLALNILKLNGQCAFITTNYYVTADGAKNLRSDLKKRSIIKDLINFNELKIFESALGQHNLITILSKAKNLHAKCRLINVNRKGFIDNTFNNIINENDKGASYNKISQLELYEGENDYIRLSKENASSKLTLILNKICMGGCFLGDIANINKGIVTGADKVSDKHLRDYSLSVEKGEGIFVLTKDEYRKKRFNSIEVSRIHPWFKNSDIGKYYSNKNNNYYLIDICYPADKFIDLQSIPNFINHLVRYRTILENRKTTANGLDKVLKNGFWWTLESKRQIKFDGAKIICPQRSKTNIFAYNEDEWYASADVYFITEPNPKYNLKYILALLNSKLYYLWLYNKGKRKGETLELYQKPLSEIPIKYTQNQQVFINIVDKILELTQSYDYLESQEKQTQVKKYQDEIDIMVYKLYELDYSEVLTIDPDFQMSELDYNNYSLHSEEAFVQ